MEIASLTKDEIKEILNDIPLPPGVGKTAREISRRYTIKRLKKQLEGIKIPKVKPALDELKRTIIDNIYKSFIEHGKPVGITAGISTAAPITQMSLNTFHYAGTQSGVAESFKKISDYLTGSQMNRDPRMLIYIKDPDTGFGEQALHNVRHVGTFDQIMKLRPELEQTMANDIITDSEIYSSDDYRVPKVKKLLELFANIYPEKFGQNYLQSYPLTYVLELTLDSYRMYTHRITMNMLCKAIKGLIQEGTGNIACVWETQLTKDPKMYIFLDENILYSGGHINDENSAKLLFLHRYLIHQFDKFYVSGMKGILAIHPVAMEIRKAIQRVRRSKRDPRYVLAFTTHVYTRWNGPSLADIKYLFEKAGFQTYQLIKTEKLYVGVIYTLEEEKKNGRNLLEELDKRINDATDRSERRTIDPDHEAIFKEYDQNLIDAARIYHIESEGINTDDIIWRDDIDNLRTRTDKPHIMLQNLGIDAVRTYLIFRFRQMLTDFSSYINTRHIALMFDLLTNLGIINSLTFFGINRRGVGPLTLASYERVMEVFTNSAIFGSEEEILGVTSSLYVGQKSKLIGTGSIRTEDIVEEKKEILPTEEEIAIDLLGLREAMKDIGESLTYESLRKKLAVGGPPTEILSLGEIPEPVIAPEEDILTELRKMAVATEVSEVKGTSMDVFKPDEASKIIPRSLASPLPIANPELLRNIKDTNIMSSIITTEAIAGVEVKPMEGRITTEDIPIIPGAVSSIVGEEVIPAKIRKPQKVTVSFRDVIRNIPTQQQVLEAHQGKPVPLPNVNLFLNIAATITIPSLSGG